MRNTAPRRRTNVIEGRNSYMYMNSSVAPVLPQREYPPKRKRTVPAERSYVRVRERVNAYILPIVFCIITIVSLSLALLCIYAKKGEIKSEMTSVRRLTRQVDASTERIEMKLNETLDMEEIKKTAVTKFGMQAAVPYQIVSINVPKDSYSVQYDDDVAKAKKESFLEKIGLKKD